MKLLFVAVPPIVKSIEDGSSKGAYYGSAILAPIGKHAGRITTSAVIWGTSYVFNGLGWVAANVCNGITYVASPIWDAFVVCNQRAADLRCSLDQVPDWQIVNVHGEHEQGTELKDLTQLRKCPLGLLYFF